MAKNNEVEYKAIMLKKMDKHLRKNISNEELFWGIWAVYMPDEASEDDYLFIAEHEDLYNECLEAFMRCVVLDK